MSNVGARSPVVLIRVGDVRVDIPRIGLQNNFRAHAVSLDFARCAVASHPIVDWLVDGKLAEQLPCGGRPNDVRNCRPNVLGFDQVRCHFSPPVSCLRVSQVEDSAVGRQRMPDPLEGGGELCSWRGIVFEDKQWAISVLSCPLEAVAPRPDVRGSAAALAAAQGQSALLVGVQVIPTLADGSTPLVANVSAGVPGSAHLIDTNLGLSSISGREASEGKTTAPLVQPCGAAGHPVGSTVEVDDDSLHGLQHRWRVHGLREGQGNSPLVGHSQLGRAGALSLSKGPGHILGVVAVAAAEAALGASLAGGRLLGGRSHNVELGPRRGAVVASSERCAGEAVRSEGGHFVGTEVVCNCCCVGEPSVLGVTRGGRSFA
mmetsp:Transcript_35317/g.75262  ORF Transcript_35317/g.75262 Transcript_35317/m.75262 type:complete len:374 (-) Transcript_35317:12-1133(-)